MNCLLCNEPVDERSHREQRQCVNALKAGRDRRDADIRRLTEKIVMLEAALATAQKPEMAKAKR